MNVLLDANILLRTVEPGHAQHRPANDATDTLRAQGHVLCVVPQVLYAFWVVCTRPAAVNGLGKSAAEARAELAAVKAGFTVLNDTPAIFPQWESLVTAHAVLGKNAHDARLVAAMLVHGVTHLLTFNEQDFRRFPGITVLTPVAVLAPAPPPTP
jgi:predicted nucleic acid-binding protein